MKASPLNWPLAPMQTATQRLGFHWFLAVVTALLIGLPANSSGQATLTTILTNGPASNRLNIVVLSEAYDAADLAAKFLSDATNAVNNLFSFQPYQEYRSYCNAYAISVASVQSGSSHPYFSISKNTYFKSSYDDYDFQPGIITIPPFTQDMVYADGMGKVDALLASLMPQSGLAILVVNDPLEGGSGGPLCVVSSADTSYFPEITAHESGHTLGKLGDEYDYGYIDIAVVTNQQPNTTQSTNLAAIKWNAWIPANTPIPTEQADQQYAGVVGLFQGANYNSNGWYRPELTCLMRSLDSKLTFCSVCSEALLKAIYTKAHPIDSFTPASNIVAITSPQTITFSVTPLQPATHSLSIQWSTNGTPIAGETNNSYELLPRNFATGSNTLQARVSDLTPLVRNDPSNLLTATVSWALNISVHQLEIDSTHWQPGGKFSFRLSGNAPHGFVVQGATNLTGWTPLATNNLVNGQFIYTNNSLTNLNWRFYRALLLP